MTKPKLRYDKSRRTIAAEPGSTEEKWTTALADIRHLRTAMKDAVEVLKEGHDAETAIGILETGLGRPARIAYASGFLSEKDIAALCGGGGGGRR